MISKLDDLSLAIGGLRSEMRLLSQTVKDNQQASTREHRLVHDIVVATAESMRVLASKVNKMEPLTEDYRERRAENRGAKRLLRPFYLAIGGVAGAVAAKAIDIFSVKPHP